MKQAINLLVPGLLLLLAGSCASTKVEPTHEIQPTSTATAPAPLTRSCTPTLDDGVSPSYVPNTPERTVVGKGHVVTGFVLSSKDCHPIPHAKLEFWPEEEGLGHPDSSRATFYTDENGRYRFEYNMPDHIHMRISAEGYRIIGVNSYHPNGQAEGTFDIVLQPEE
jgi:protocatechuate 3,4-dioxygenase beta subunit